MIGHCLWPLGWRIKLLSIYTLAKCASQDYALSQSSSMRHFKQKYAGTASRTYFVLNFAMQRYTHTHHISWKSNKGTMKPRQHMYTNLKQRGSKRCSFNSSTATICIFIKSLWDAHNTAAKIYKKDPQTLLEVIKIIRMFNAAQQVTATLTSSAFNMMSSDDQCFVCGKTGHIGCNCPNMQCYSCKEFSHFVQDCPDKISPSGTSYQHNRLCSQPCYDHNHRDKLQCLNYRHNHRRHFN